MGLEQEIDQDIHSFYEDLDKCSRSEKFHLLKKLLSKYAQFPEKTHYLDSNDLFTIIGGAKTIFPLHTFPVYLGNSKEIVKECDQANLCVIESTIRFLNKNDCLKQLPKFDYRENKF